MLKWAGAKAPSRLTLLLELGQILVLAATTFTLYQFSRTLRLKTLTEFQAVFSNATKTVQDDVPAMHRAIVATQKDIEAAAPTFQHEIETTDNDLQKTAIAYRQLARELENSADDLQAHTAAFGSSLQTLGEATTKATPGVATAIAGATQSLNDLTKLSATTQTDVKTNSVRSQEATVLFGKELQDDGKALDAAVKRAVDALNQLTDAAQATSAGLKKPVVVEEKKKL